MGLDLGWSLSAWRIGLVFGTESVLLFFLTGGIEGAEERRGTRGPCMALYGC